MREDSLRDLPRRTQENLLSTLIDAHSALQTASRVGPDDSQRTEARRMADELNEWILEEINRLEGGEES